MLNSEEKESNVMCPVSGQHRMCLVEFLCGKRQRTVGMDKFDQPGDASKSMRQRFDARERFL